jgi:ParB family chromosome partitioning protein
MSIKDQPKRLGRGLAALMGEAAAPVAPDAPGVRTLPVELLEPSPFQPRREMDETALSELADSITQRGVLQPLLVRPKPGHEG